MSSVGTSRDARCIAAMATHLNAGLYGSRFVGDCEVSTNGERVWLKGHRVPTWVAWVRVACEILFLPAAIVVGVVLVRTLLSAAAPPYYGLAAALLGFLVVVLGTWSASIWECRLTSYEAISWPAMMAWSRGQIRNREMVKGATLWMLMNTLITTRSLTQVQVPVGPEGKLRRLILKLPEKQSGPLKVVLSGTVTGPALRDADGPTDPWAWSRN